MASIRHTGPRTAASASRRRFSLPIAPIVWGFPLLAWQVAFLLVPSVLLVLMSFWKVENFRLVADYNVQNWIDVVGSAVFTDVVVRTVLLALFAAAIAFVLAFPFAYALTFKVSPTARRLALALLIAPFFTAYLLRLYAWNFMLSDQGVVNYLLAQIGLGPIVVLGSWTGIVIGYLANFFPLITIVLVLSLLSVDRTLIEAANNLGAGRVRTVFAVVMRSAKVGVLLAVTFAFILAFGDPVAPQILGLGRHPTLGDLVSAEKQGGVDFPSASVVAVVMVVLVLVIVFVATWLAFPARREPKGDADVPGAARTDPSSRLSLSDARRRTWPWTGVSDRVVAHWRRNPARQAALDRGVDRASNVAFKGYIGLCFLFIYAPLAALVLFSFADHRYPTLPWPGFTTEWYTTLTDDPDVLASLWNSIIVALIVGVAATILGSMGAYFLNRWDFRGKNVYLGIVIVGPCIPLVILGLTLFIFLQRINLSNSLTAVVISHIGYAAAFAVGIVRMRLLEMNKYLEQAAWNLGANSWRAALLVVLPMALPSVIAAFFLTMAVSWNEFVIAWFVSGLDTTLPVKLFNYFAGNVSPRVNAIGTIVLCTSFLLIAVSMVFAFAFGRRHGAATPEIQGEARA